MTGRPAPVADLPVLLVDDESPLLESGARALRHGGIQPVLTCSDPREVLGLLDAQTIGAVVLDLSMPHLSGEQLLGMIAERHPDIPVIVMTASAVLDTAVACMKNGAVDYLVKPVEPVRFCSAVRRAREARSLQSEITAIRDAMLRTSAKIDPAFSTTVTQSPAMFALFRYLGAVAPTSNPILITGETGTGKQLIAEAIHRISGRPGELHEVGSGLLSGDETHVADELFGHVRGAFTSAEGRRAGHVARAGDGTLFLDEIGDMPLATQKMLLWLLQSGRYYPVGSDEVATCRARIVAATNQDLDRAQREGRFRLDLLHRLSTHHVHLPPLRERPGDIPLLVHHFAERIATQLGRPVPKMPSALFQLLGSHPFPGNVRELESMMREALTVHERGTLSTRTFRRRIQRPPGEPSPAVAAGPPAWLPERLPTFREMRQILLQEAMRRASGNRGLAADMLGVTRQALSLALKDPKPPTSG
jgi:two-component system nitrogen regulation response regulator GlnG